MLELIADIEDQPAALLRNAAVLEEAYSELPRWVGSRNGVVVSGMATSLWAWHSAGIILQEQAAPPIITDASEYLRYGRAARDERPLLLTSRSGESAEIVKLLDVVRPGRTVVGVTEDRASQVGTRATHRLAFEAGETAFHNTKSFTLTLAIALAAAAGLAGRRDLAPMSWIKRLAGVLREVVTGGAGAYEAVAAALAPARVVLLTARGHHIGVSQQAALDLQEGMRLAAMAVPGGLLRHGPMELVRLSDSAVVMMIPRDHMAATMIQAVEDLVALDARVVAIVEDGVVLPSRVPSVVLPRVEAELSPILFAAALQRLNVALARTLGLTSITPTLIPKITRVE
jgi:fructoselysine-6-P-deglycase FrlB-like protein